MRPVIKIRRLKDPEQLQNALEDNPDEPSNGELALFPCIQT